MDTPVARPRLTRLELGELALIAVTIGATWILAADLAWSPQLRWLFGYCAAVILGQGLLRDVVRLLVKRRQEGEQRRIVCLCAESTLGLVLLVAGCGGLSMLGVEETRTLGQISLTLLVGALLVTGFLAKDYVVTVRRETDHASLVLW